MKKKKSPILFPTSPVNELLASLLLMSCERGHFLLSFTHHTVALENTTDFSDNGLAGNAPAVIHKG